MKENGVILEGPQVRIEELCIYELFEKEAEVYPDRPALIFENKTLTYGEVNEKANRLANHLKSRGYKHGDRIGIYITRSLEMVLAIIAVNKLGGAYVPLDPNFPEKRLADIIEDSQPAAIIINKEFSFSLPVQCELIFYTHQDKKWTDYSSKNLNAGYFFNDPIYILYTSGSTGKPKGIEQVNRASSNLVQWQNQFMGIDFTKPVLQFTSICFDVSIQEVFSALSQGGTVIIANDEERLDVRMLLNLIEMHQISTAFLSVSTFLNFFSEKETFEEIPASLLNVVTAGEQIIVNQVLNDFLKSRPSFTLHNHYGPSEGLVVSSYIYSHSRKNVLNRPPVGTPVQNVKLRLTPIDTLNNEAGEVWVNGICLADQYVNLKEMTDKHFVFWEGDRWYRTGDIAKLDEKGQIEFLGRIDDQIKIDGKLVEISEVEKVFSLFEGVNEFAIKAFDKDNNKILVGYYAANKEIDLQDLRQHFTARLPSYMTPSLFARLPKFQKTPTGKIDLKSLQFPELSSFVDHNENQAHSLDPEDICQIIAENLSLPGVHIDDNIFELGARSLNIIKIVKKIEKISGIRISPVQFYKTPQIKEFISFYDEHAFQKKTNDKYEEATYNQSIDEIAIIGMGIRCPGAASLQDFWQNLLDEKETLERTEFLQRKKGDLYPLFSKNYVSKSGNIKDAYGFDNEFFDISRQEALWMDPQHRVFLELAWEALEDAGIDLSKVENRHIGIFAGCAESTYILRLQKKIESMTDYLQAQINNDKDYLSSRISFKLNLTGPAVNVQSACSTSLLAVHMACQSILNGECNAALAGGVSVLIPQDTGYFYEEGSIYSEDGCTRPYSNSANGVVITNGAGIVVLKPLKKALQDNNRIYGVIKASAINNDGAQKSNYTAPSIEGQANVIKAAMGKADVNYEEMDYIEGHGTGTLLGDPIEVEALNTVYSENSSKKQYCGIGSVKSNIGHTNRASGVIGLIKASLIAHNKVIPPTIYCDTPNVHIPWSDTAFYVTNVKKIFDKEKKLNIGVSSFGIGGTNVHVILQSPPATSEEYDAPHSKLFILSAKTRRALSKKADNLHAYLKKMKNKDINLTDVSMSLCVASTPLEFRKFFTATNKEELLSLIESAKTSQSSTKKGNKKPIFVFSGNGDSLYCASRELYKSNELYREILRETLDQIPKDFFYNLENILLGEAQSESTVRKNLDEENPHIAQPALLAFQYSFSKFLMNVGINPAAVCGHSGGEFAAACIAGIISIQDAFKLVISRGRAFEKILGQGCQLSVSATKQELKKLNLDRYISVQNADNRHVLSLMAQESEDVISALKKAGIGHLRLSSTIPVHTEHMKKCFGDIGQLIGHIKFSQSQIPFYSSVIGKLYKEVPESEYWEKHMTQPVKFQDCISAIHHDYDGIFLEIGPNDTATKIMRNNLADKARVVSFYSAADKSLSRKSVLIGLASLWEYGVSIDWRKLFSDVRFNQLSLPAYPFDRKKFWIDLETNDRAAQAPFFDVSFVRAPLLKGSEITSDLLHIECKKIDIANDRLNYQEIYSHIEQIKMELQNCNQICFIYRVEDAGHLTADYTFGYYKALALTLSQELGIKTRLCVIENKTDESNVKDIALEFQQSARYETILFKEGARFIEVIEPACIRDRGFPSFHAKGTYLIIGGLGNVGYCICTEILNNFPDVSLYIVGKTPEEHLENKKKRLESLKAKGRNVQYISADLLNEKAFCNALIQHVKPDNINGVLNLAAHIDQKRFMIFLNQISQENIKKQVGPKFQSIKSICQFLGDYQPDFIVNFSSLASYLAGTGYFSYSLANLLLDTKISRLHARQRFVNINWDVWQTSSESVERNISLGSSNENIQILPGEGFMYLDQLIRSGRSQTFVTKSSSLEERRAPIEILNENNEILALDDEPIDELQNTIMNIWKNTLGIENVFDVSASFVELGGDSLTAVKAILLINRKLETHIPVSKLLETQSFLSFCTYIEEQWAEQNPLALPEITTFEPQQNYTPSPLQERWYDVWQKGYGNLVLPIFLDKIESISELFSALENTLNNHEIFRTVYSLQKNKGLQAHISEKKIPVSKIDYTAYSEKDVFENLNKLLSEIEKIRLDLKASPLTAFFVEISDSKALIVIKIHHIAMDGWSSSLFIDRLCKNYHANTDGFQEQLRYQHFAKWHNAYLQTEEVKRLSEKWKEELKGLALPDYILPVKNKIEPENLAQKIHFVIDKENLNLIDAYAHRVGLTRFSFFFMAYALTVSFYTKRDDFILGTTSSGRHKKGSEEIMGVFVNPLPIRIGLNKNNSLSDFIKQIQSKMALFQESQNYPVYQLIEDIGIATKGKDIDLFRAYILYQNFRKPDKDHSLNVKIDDADDEITDPYLSCFQDTEISLMRDIEMLMFEKDEGCLFCNFWFRLSLLDNEEALRFVALFQSVIEKILDTVLTQKIQNIERDA